METNIRELAQMICARRNVKFKSLIARNINQLIGIATPDNTIILQDSTIKFYIIKILNVHIITALTGIPQLDTDIGRLNMDVTRRVIENAELEFLTYKKNTFTVGQLSIHGEVYEIEHG